MMRLKLLALALVAVFASNGAQAQDWIEFADHQWGVGINFPGEPTVEDFEFVTQRERMVPGRVWRVENETGRYTLTAVSFTRDPTDSLTAVAPAIAELRTKGTVTYDGYINLDGVPGWMLSITEPDGRLLQAAAYFVDQRLYIAEGSVTPGTPPPSNFQQSIIMYDASGERISVVNR
jgi:hypothetical protein